MSMIESTYNPKNGDGIVDEFKLGFLNTWNNFINDAHVIFSLILATFLTAIGWNNYYAVVSFLVNLAVLDIITKHIGLTIISYGKFSIKNYFKAWQNKILTSSKFKVGFFIKVVCYSILFYIANQVQISTEIFQGNIVANLIYSGIFIAEVSSLGENFRDMGFKQIGNLMNNIKGLFKKN